MIDHVTLWVKNIDESKKFYQTALEPLGYEGAVSGKTISCFAFTAKNKRQVDDFYHAAIKAGGKDNGPPGYRPEYSTYYSGYYAAFVLDPNGYNIEAVWDDLKKDTDFVEKRP